jgi:hypothetical protein
VLVLPLTLAGRVLVKAADTRFMADMVLCDGEGFVELPP